MSTWQLRKGFLLSMPLCIPQRLRAAGQALLSKLGWVFNTPSSLGLDDMPQDWLMQLVSLLDSSSRLALAQTCTTLRDAVLLHGPGLVHFNPSHALTAIQGTLGDTQASSSVGLQQLKHSLQLALQLRPGRVHLILANSTSLCNEAGRPTSLDTTCCHLLSDMQLQGIHSVTLQGHTQSCLMPTYLARNCYRMESLILEHCTIANSHPPSVILACPSVQSLHLNNVHIQSEVASNHLVRQMRAFSRLQNLKVEGPCEPLIRALRSRNRTFTCPLLTTIELVNNVITDGGMAALMRLPSLHHVKAHRLALKHDISHKKLAWDTFHLREMDVASVAFCPETTQLRLVGSHASPAQLLVQQTENHLMITEIIDQAVSYVTQDCPNWLSCCTALSLNIDSTFALTSPQEILVAVTPLLCSYAGSLQISDVQLDVELARCLGALHASKLVLHNVRFHADVWTELLPCLTHVQHLVIHGYDRADFLPIEPHVVKLCVAAQTPVQVTVQEAVQLAWGNVFILSEGWRDRVRAAMQAAGHQHVTL